MTPPAVTSTAPGDGLERWELPAALREALADDVTNLIVSMTEAVLVSGLGFKGPYEEFGTAVKELVLDALASARRDGAQIANESGAAALAAANARAERPAEALRFYADDENYRLHGACNPEHSYFTGPDTARAALGGGLVETQETGTREGEDGR